jgi:hypothetical protein
MWWTLAIVAVVAIGIAVGIREVVRSWNTPAPSVTYPDMPRATSSPATDGDNQSGADRHHWDFYRGDTGGGGDGGGGIG